MNEQDRTIVYVVKTTTGQIFKSIPQPFYGVRPSGEACLRGGLPFTVRMADGPLTINPQYILYIQELTEPTTPG